jgi:osmotically-inducible protein OsmY
LQIGGRYSGAGKERGVKSDKDLQHDVLEEMRWDPSVDAAHVGVSVKYGVVTLSGHVSSFAEKHAAERAAKRVHGVRAVANELNVKLPYFSRRTDEDIAGWAANLLSWNFQVPADKIMVTVSNGWVTLEGEVEWQYQEAAERVVRSLTGVVGVSNQIKNKPRVSPDELKSKIEDAFKRSAELDARRISVEVAHERTCPRSVTPTSLMQCATHVCRSIAAGI